MTNHAVYPKLIILSYWNTPSGVLFLFGETGPSDLKTQMQLSGGQLPATARRSRTLIFRSIGTKNVTNLAGTSTDK